MNSNKLPPHKLSSELCDSARKFVISLWDEGSGGFRFAPEQPATLMATSYAVLGLEFVGGLLLITESQKSKIIRYLMSAAQLDGSFRDPLFKMEDVVSSEHDLSYFQEETTTFCQQALDALLAPPPPSRVWPSNWLSPEGLIKYFESLPWKNPWLDSNRVMFVLSQLCHDADRHGKPELLAGVDRVLDWLDEHQNPETGLWKGPYEVPLENAMAATFHFTFYYLYRHRPLKHLDRVIDSCLSLQQHHGLFSGGMVGQTCLDYDAIDLLAKASLYSDYRQKDVQASLRRATRALASLYNEADGGFANCKERVVTVQRHRYAKWLSRLGVFCYPAKIRVPIDGDYTVCWRLLSSGNRESNVFSTWFRCLALVLAHETQDVRSDTGLNVRFRRLPFLGFHKRSITTE